MHCPTAVTSIANHAGYVNAREAAAGYDSEDYTDPTTGDSGCDVRHFLKQDVLKLKYTPLHAAICEGMYIIMIFILWTSLCILITIINTFYLLHR